jgi:hypothetical protein
MWTERSFIVFKQIVPHVRVYQAICFQRVIFKAPSLLNQNIKFKSQNLFCSYTVYLCRLAVFSLKINSLVF